jgi:hypothetical protein
MAETKNRGWNFARFWKTLTFFDIIPFTSCWRRLLNSRPLKKNFEFLNNMQILVIGADNDLGEQVIACLLNNGYSVTTLVEEGQVFPNLPIDRLAIWEGNLSNPHSLKPEMLQNTIAVIDCVVTPVETTKLNNLVDFVAQHRQSTTDKLIFDFTNPSNDLKEIWGALDDVVMGGVSTSNLHFSDNRGMFAGIVSTDNNGGFASIRTRNFTPPLNLSNYEGIELRVTGDGKRYKFITRCEGKWDGIGYCYSFDTIDNFPTTIIIPFADLVPVFRAKTVPEADNFDSSRVYSMQLMLSKFEYDGGLNPKFEPGSFGLQIEYIKAYGGKKQTQFIVASLTNETSTIESVKQILVSSGLTYQIISSNETSPESSKSIALRCLKAIE